MKMKYVNANNIDMFIGCEIINGPLFLMNWTLAGSVQLLLELYKTRGPSIARDDPSLLPGMHRDHNAPACTARCGRIVGCDHSAR